MDQRPEFLCAAIGHQALEFLKQAQIRSFAGVWNKPKHGVLNIPVDGVKHAKRQIAAERFALFVNIRIVSAAEIDAFEGALPLRCRWKDAFHRVFTVRLHDQRMAWRQLLNITRPNAKDRSKSGAFACHSNGLSRLHPECRANTVGVTKHESVTITDDSAKDIAAVETLGGVAQDARDIKFLRDHRSKFAAF